jgi:hypothetical protein
MAISEEIIFMLAGLRLIKGDHERLQEEQSHPAQRQGAAGADDSGHVGLAASGAKKL